MSFGKRICADLFGSIWQQSFPCRSILRAHQRWRSWILCARLEACGCRHCRIRACFLPRFLQDMPSLRLSLLTFLVQNQLCVDINFTGFRFRYQQFTEILTSRIIKLQTICPICIDMCCGCDIKSHQAAWHLWHLWHYAQASGAHRWAAVTLLELIGSLLIAITACD